jgi:phytoene dehydrogenase-like protein
VPDALDLSAPVACDVAIAGAGLAGLVAGAILARRGLSVVVVDAAPQVGARGGGTEHRGFWLDAGQRDGADVGDLQIGWRYGQVAAAEAGVEVPLRPVEPRMRVHHVTGDAHDVVEGAWTGVGFLAFAERALGCPAAKLGEFAKALAELAGASAAERRAAVPIPLGAWCAERVPDTDVRRTLATLVSVIFCERPEQASVGRLMSFFARRDDLPPLVTAYADHPAVGGMQGLHVPFADAIHARGGRLLLGLAPRAVRFDGERASGLVAVDEGNRVLEVDARHVVLALPLGEALALLPPARVPPALARLAERLADESAEAVGLALALRRAPRVRATGEPDVFVGWNRILEGPGRSYAGGWQLPSLASRRVAPEGQHLLHAYRVHWLRRSECMSREEVRTSAERTLGRLRRFYADLDECTLWSAVQWVARPSCMAWYWAPLERHGIAVPELPGVLLAGSSFESEAGPLDIAAHAGLEAARSVLHAEARP